MSHKLYQRTGSGDGDNLKNSAHVVIESVDHIKTVIALGAGEFFVNSVNKHLHSHMRLVVHSSTVTVDAQFHTFFNTQ